MEGLVIDSATVYRGARPRCWTRRRSCTGYQRLPAAPRAAPGRGIRLGGRGTTTVLGSAAWRRLGRLRRRATIARSSWASPLRLLSWIVDTYINTMLLSTRTSAKESVSSSSSAAALASPPKLRRDGSLSGSTRRRDAACGRGVVLNICVGEVLLRRTTSEIRRSPLQQPRKPARCTSVRA